MNSYDLALVLGTEAMWLTLASRGSPGRPPVLKGIGLASRWFWSEVWSDVGDPIGEMNRDFVGFVLPRGDHTERSLAGK